MLRKPPSGPCGPGVNTVFTGSGLWLKVIVNKVDSQV